MVNPPPVELGTLGMSDTLILMILALVVFGPRRLPQIGRQIGKLMYEFRKASNDFKFQMEEELRLAEEADRRKKDEAERARNLALNPPPAQTIESEAAVGAQESVSAPAHPLYGSGYPEQTPPEAAAAPVADEPPPTVPRIQPPSTGAPVAAERPGPRDQQTAGTTAPEAVAAEANIGADPVAGDSAGNPSEPPAEPSIESAKAEPLSQHG